MFRISQRELKRLLKRAGVSMSEIEGVERVEVILPDRKYIVKNPIVTRMDLKGETVLQVVGKLEEVLEGEVTPEISEEDVEFVAQQAGVDVERARDALLLAGGDIAKAIMLARGGDVE